MIKLLLGGSPCTNWSIAKKDGRETEPSGIGWELFNNYAIAKRKFSPDIFLYENVASASPLIKEAISDALGVDLIRINSALVSAQNRDRIYGTGAAVGQPEDRHIYLRDIIESGAAFREKAYALDANYYKTLGRNVGFDRQAGRRAMVAEPVGTTNGGKSYALTSTYGKASARDVLGHGERSMVAEPVRIGTIENDAQTPEHDSQQYRVYSPDGKSVALCGNGGGMGAKTGLYATPVCTNGRDKADCLRASYGEKCGTRNMEQNVIVRGRGYNGIIEPVPMYDYPHGFNAGGIRYRDKANTLTGNGKYEDNHKVIVPACLRRERTEEGKQLRKAYEAGEIQHGYNEHRDLHPRTDGKTNTLTTVTKDNLIIDTVDGKTRPIYEVRDGIITIKDKQYPIKLEDGYYIIRKLTVTECCRLQTLPDDYCRAVSASQGYKGLGNGWTAEMITHILSAALAGVPRSEKLKVLSMYDGIGTGLYCLKAMGFTDIEYHACEIDKYAMQISNSNHDGIIHHGDAFGVREGGWKL